MIVLLYCVATVFGVYLCVLGLARCAAEVDLFAADVEQARTTEPPTDLGEHFRQVDPASCPCARCCAAVDLVRSIADPLAWDRAFVEQLERP